MTRKPDSYIRKKLIPITELLARAGPNPKDIPDAMDKAFME